MRCSPRLGGELLCAPKLFRHYHSPDDLSSDDWGLSDPFWGTHDHSREKYKTRKKTQKPEPEKKTKNPFFRPKKPPKKLYAAVWGGQKP